MWPFRRKSLPGENIGASPAEEKALALVFQQCNFDLARDELANFFRMAEAQAKREGNEGVAFKTEFVQGWHAFSDSPNAGTARAWLRAAPSYGNIIRSYLVECCPGGRFTS